jgi:hypothetical protein
MAQIGSLKFQAEFAARQAGHPYYRNKSGRRWMAQSAQTPEPNFLTSRICTDRRGRVKGQQSPEASGLTEQQRDEALYPRSP